MTQNSIPQTGHIDDNVSPDAGPYSAVEWSAVWSSILTSGVNQGPIGIIGDDSLAVTNPSGTTINVAAGDAMVGGRNFRNDASLSFSVASPSANPRIDVVVVVQNESNSSITAGIASGNDLSFPTSLTDYQGSASVPPYSARVAILKGTEAASPSAPTLDQNAALLYMIPLAQYQISTGGTISALTNLREFTVSAGGGNAYVDTVIEYPSGGPMDQIGYNGRVRIVPMRLYFNFVGSTSMNISFENEDDPLLGYDEYATFFFWTVNPQQTYSTFDGKVNGLGFTIYKSPGESFIRIYGYRAGYVDNAGTAQAPPTNETVVIDCMLVQLLDQAPLSFKSIAG